MTENTEGKSGQEIKRKKFAPKSNRKKFFFFLGGEEHNKKIAYNIYICMCVYTYYFFEKHATAFCDKKDTI